MGFIRYHVPLDEKLGGLFGLVLGLGLYLGGGHWVQQRIAYERANFRETQGMIVDNAKWRSRDSDNKERITYAPVVEFQANGQTLQFQGLSQSYPSSTQKSVIVRYDPQQPTHASIVEPLENLTPWAMYAIGGFAALCSAGSLLPVRWSSTLRDRPDQ